MQEEIVYKVLQLLEEKTGLKARWYAIANDKKVDGTVELKLQKERINIPAEFKKEVKNIHLSQFYSLKNQYPDLIVIAETIFPVIREQLRTMNVNYADANGNCYIKKDKWVFFVDGFKTDTPQINKKDRAFTKTGLLLLFHLLNDEKYLNVTYRQMSEDYGIALGNVNYIMNSLKDQGYLIKTDRKSARLINKKKLFEEWITAYEQKLKPQLSLGSYRFLNSFDKDWRKLPLDNYETQWGGEPAASLLTGYLKPAKLVLYTSEKKIDLIKKYKLVPDEKGLLSIYNKFWKFECINSDTVPDMLVYADLINSNDPRNLETATLLYDRLFKEQL
ncbi:MAG: type IV toxin-antitoxin system AbiEi family antitoxin [Daejeonella sp.]|uniref:type IV toxin-antitoxin system AbiEi family antitoxin n=1 Tax=Daejeonella sp. TaxID=2805397 RepID=UPI003C70DD18